MRDELKTDLDERDYAKQPLTRLELEDLFAGREPRDFLNPKSPAFKSLGLKGKTLTEKQALDLMAKEPNLIKRPLIIIGHEIITGFDRDALRKALA